MEPPSPSLLHALQSLELANAKDLRLAARRCRRLAIDLPTFDSVWIDALVSLRRVTRFQAGKLERGKAAELRFGSLILLDRIGERADAETYLARRPSQRPPCVLKKLSRTVGSDASLVERLHDLTRQVLRSELRYVIAPHEVITSADGEIGLLSRYVEGRNGRQELIRQGRLSGEAVSRIASQLLTGLGEAHATGLVHGDVCLKNIRLNRRGDAVLVDAAVCAILSPFDSIYEMQQPDDVVGLAPERIGSTEAPSPAADLYSLGCALWQLLAGRPPFASGDPLAVLVAHRTKNVPNIRDFAPDAPGPLIDAVTWMTARDPADRPTDLVELRRTLRPQTRVRRTVRREPARPIKQAARLPWVSAAATLLAFGAASVWLYQQDTAAVLQAANNSSDIGGGLLADGSEFTTAPQLSQLPKPDATGTVRLEHPGPFSAADILARGPLIVRGDKDRPAIVVVTDRPLLLRADEVTLENLNIVHEQIADGADPSALVLVEAQNFSVRSCRFESEIGSSSGAHRTPAVAWRMIDPADPTAGTVSIQDCVGRSVREMLYTADTPRKVVFDNVLCVGAQRFVSVGSLRNPVKLSLNHVTIRDAACVVATGSQTSDADVKVSATDCIFNLLEGGRLHSPSESRVAWRGLGVVTSRDCWPSSGNVPTDDEAAASLEGDTGSVVEGMLPADISFAGPASESDAASIARVTGVPRRAGHTLGFELSRLPRPSIYWRTAR